MDTKSTSTGSGMLLTGAILMAQIDLTGLADYALKAAIGGGIWLGYKMTADYLDRRKKSKQGNQ